MLHIKTIEVALDHQNVDGDFVDISWKLFSGEKEIRRVSISEVDIIADDTETGKELSQFAFNDFPKDFEITLDLEQVDCFIIDVKFKTDQANSDTSSNKKIDIRFAPDLKQWIFPFSFYVYKNSLEKLIEETPFPIIKFDKEPFWDFLPSFRFSTTLENTNISIYKNVEVYINKLKQLHQRAIERLKAELNLNVSVSTSFQFPQAIKEYCEQYLLYFARFLRDLGINATSNLKEEAGKVLFSVTPTDDVEALDRIREALAVYLNLPASPVVYDDSFAAMRLQQQIENLQHSQRMIVRELQFNEKLLLAQSDTIHEKNITISQQQTVIEQQNKIIEKISSQSIMMDSLENKEELEEFCDGLKIGESEWLKKQLGIYLNPAKVIKTGVKNLFGYEEPRRSILGLDESEDK